MREIIYKFDDSLKNELYSSVSSTTTVLVMVYQMDFDDNAKSTLSKLLQAVKIDQNSEVSVVKLTEPSVRLNELIANSNINKVLVFGIAPKDLNLNIEAAKYKIAKFEKIEVLFSDSIPVMSADKNLKVYLWNSLKLLFNI